MEQALTIQRVAERQLQEALGIIERKIAAYDAVARGEDADRPTEPPPTRRVYIRAAG